MTTRITRANGLYDLSHINTLEELEEEIALIESSLKKDEEQLETHFRHLPQRIVKSTADTLLPSFLNKLIANGTWKLLLSGITMFANPFSGKFSFKKNILGSAKKLGLMALVKGAYDVWKNKNAAKDKPVIATANKPQITSLKTKNFKRN